MLLVGCTRKANNPVLLGSSYPHRRKRPLPYGRTGPARGLQLLLGDRRGAFRAHRGRAGGDPGRPVSGDGAG